MEILYVHVCDYISTIKNGGTNKMPLKILNAN